MDSLTPEPTQSWFAVKAALGLSPILILGIAGVIGWSLRHTLWRRGECTDPA